MHLYQKLSTLITIVMVSKIIKLAVTMNYVFTMSWVGKDVIHSSNTIYDDITPFQRSFFEHTKVSLGTHSSPFPFLCPF